MDHHPCFTSDSKPPNKDLGWFVNFLIVVAILLIATVGGVWQIIIHTSLPLGFISRVIEDGHADSNLRITGASGSLSSGLNFEKIEWDHGEITGVRFRYAGIRDIIGHQSSINEIDIGSATLKTSFFSDTWTKFRAARSPSSQVESPDAAEIPSESSPQTRRILQLGRVSLNNITIKDPASGNGIVIPRIEWAGFKAEEGATLEFGNFEAASDQLVIKTTNPPASEYQKRVEITLLPALHESIRKPIRIELQLGEKDQVPIFHLEAFDRALRLVHGEGNIRQLRASGADLADFFDAPVPNEIHLDAEISDSTLAVRAGSFLLGTKRFEIQPSIDSGDHPESHEIVALHRDEAGEIRCDIPFYDKKTGISSFKPSLTRTPVMGPEDLMALLFHDRDFSDLPTNQQEDLRQHMAWFSFPE